MGYMKPTSSDIWMPVRGTAQPRTEHVTLRARRSSPAPANAKPHLPRTDQLALTDIAQRFAPGAGAQSGVATDDQRFESRPQVPQMQSSPTAASPATPSPVIASVRGMRTLIAVLIAVALLPSALFGAMMWAGAIHMNWPTPWLKADAKTWQAATPASLTGPLAAAAEPSQPRSVKILNVAPPPQEKPQALRVASTEPEPEIAQEPEVTGSIAAVEDVPPVPELPYDTNLIGVVSWDVRRQPLLGATGVEEVFTTQEEPAPPPEHLMRAPAVNNDDKNWITPSQFVNLRKGPTSSAAVISVVAKGTKLAVKGRKRGWAQVTNPETSESGWIYAGSNARRSAKRGSQSEAETDSSWLSLGSWLGSR
jgi:uncharacterized protein YgiM (DUF1202 family)